MERLVEVADALLEKIVSIRRDQKRAPRSLIIEDNEPDRYLAERALKSAGHEVEIAGTGEKALEILAQKKTQADSTFCFSTSPCRT